MPVKKVLKVLKRNETYEKLIVDKIGDSIFLAAQDVGGTDKELAKKLAQEVVEGLQRHYGRLGEVTSAEVGDMVEKVLLAKGHYKTAKAYILNRERKRKLEAQKRALGVYDEVGLSLNALTVMKEKYLLKDKNGEPRESVEGAFRRVAKHVAKAERKEYRKEWQRKFLEVMKELKFLPGGRTLANAGTTKNQLANCFVMPMPDDIEGIFEAIKESSILKKYGGAVGFNFGHIRPKGDVVATTSGSACGPVALMQLLNDASDIYLQAGKRRSGNMITLPVWHPDILEFIHCKEGGKNLPHINYSISVTSKFMKAVEKNKDWQLINPRNGEVVRTLPARYILEEAARMAWRTGDPGVIFIDRINKDNPTPHVAPIETVNLCGEQPLLNYEACNLGSVNLGKFVKMSVWERGETRQNVHNLIDWQELERVVRIGVRMLDDVIDVCEYPLKKIEKTVRSNRKIGLGVMGWADMLIRLGIPYNSEQALRLARKVMKFIRDVGWDESAKIAKEKGSFPNFKGSLWEKRGYKAFRNATVTTIAPTGSIAIIGGASGGIEPHFALAYRRKSMGEYELPEVNEDLVRAIKYVNGLYSRELMDEIATQGRVGNLKKIPKKIREVFVTAMEMSPEDHVEMLAAFQEYTDNAVSKTINLPHSASVEKVVEIFKLAWQKGCKGITVYRDGSKEGQVLEVGIKNNSTLKNKSKHHLTKVSNLINKIEEGKCPNCGGKLVKEEGCSKCYGCGFSVCG